MNAFCVITTVFSSIVTALVLATATLSTHATDGHRRNGQPATQTHKPDTKNSGSQSSAITGINQPPAQSQTERPKQPAEKGERTGMDPNWIIALLTLALAFLGFKQWRTHVATLQANKVIERAYVSMSHQPPGLIFAPHVVNRERYGEIVMERDVVAIIGVLSLGNTPALVTAYTLHHSTSEPMEGSSPPYEVEKNRVVRVHIPKGDAFNVAYRFSLDERLFQHIKSGTVTLSMVGFVDYTDRFGGHHRVGYGRQYDPFIDADQLEIYWNDSGFNRTAYDARNNLPFVTVPGYNYDRERHKGEGNDWNEPK